MAVLQNAALHPQLAINRTSCIFDDFYQYVTTQNGLTTAPAGSGTAALEANADRLKLSCQATTDNDFEGIRTTQAAFAFVSGQALYAETYMELVNQATTTANSAFGFASSATLGISNGGDPTVACSAMIIKVDGSAVWKAVTSCNSVVTVTTSVNAAVDGKYLLRLDVVNYDGLNMGVTFSVNGVQLRDSNNVAIIHKVPIASSAAMYGIAQVGSGSASGTQVQYHDYVSWGKNRLMTF